MGRWRSCRKILGKNAERSGEEPKKVHFGMTNEIMALINGWRKFFGLELRRFPRYPIATEVEFYACDRRTETPLTPKGKGRLFDISPRGARLRTNTVRMGYHHLAISGGLEGTTTLMLEFPPLPEGTSCALKCRILWYNTLRADCEFKFEFGIEFLDPSPLEHKHLNSLIKPA
jgi:hypothetical protein